MSCGQLRVRGLKLGWVVGWSFFGHGVGAAAYSLHPRARHHTNNNLCCAWSAKETLSGGRPSLFFTCSLKRHRTPPALLAWLLQWTRQPPGTVVTSKFPARVKRKLRLAWVPDCCIHVYKTCILCNFGAFFLAHRQRLDQLRRTPFQRWRNKQTRRRCRRTTRRPSRTAWQCLRRMPRRKPPSRGASLSFPPKDLPRGSGYVAFDRILEFFFPRRRMPRV